MAEKGQNVEIHQGDTRQLIITVYDEYNVIMDLSGYDAEWGVYDQTSKELVIYKVVGSGLSIPNPTSGQILIDVDADDTLTLTPKNYNHECEVYIGDDPVATVTTGTFKILFGRV